MMMSSLLIFIQVLFVQAFQQHRRYIYVPTAMTWKDARTHCRENHTDLAIFGSKSEFAALQNPCRSKCWIGLQRDAKNPTIWTWVNGKEVTFSSWGRGESHQLQEKCGFLEQKIWRDGNCQAILPTICYDNDVILVNKLKTWEEALDHCRTLQTDPDSNNTTLSRHYDLAHIDVAKDEWYDVDLIQNAKTDEVWTGLRFLAGKWLWVNSFPLVRQPPLCPAPRMHCGAIQKTGFNFALRDCSEKKSFVCGKRNR